MVVKGKKIDVNKTLLVTYIVVSALFILLSALNYFKYSVYNVGVEKGVATAITQIMNKSLDTKCQPFSVWSGQTEVSLINVKCLQQAQAEAAAPVAAEEVQ